MERHVTDQMILMAQMTAETQEPQLGRWLDSFRPLIFIVIAGIIITALALYAGKQWEHHVESNIIETHEHAIHSEVTQNLTAQAQNTNAIQGFVEASTYVSEEEFESFSAQMLKTQSNTAFLAILNYQENHYIKSKVNNGEDILLALRQASDQGMFGSQSQGYINWTYHSQDQDFIIHTQQLRLENSQGPTIVMSGILLSGIIDESALDGYIHVEVIDLLGNRAAHEYNKPNHDISRHNSDLSFDNTHVKLSIQSTLDVLQSTSYLKWILISFSIVFTLSFFVQFLLARRSIRKLATLAVERANELTAINSHLTEEIMGRIEFQAELLSKNQEIQEMNEQLEEAQNQLIQQEKLASLGQLAAGVAHEINNPVGFINSNLSMLNKYADRAMQLIGKLEDIIVEQCGQDLMSKLQQEKKALKYDSLKRNMIAVIDESMEGVERVKQIVQDLKDFSRLDEAEWQWVDLHEGIDSTLNIVWNEVKYKAEVHREYGELPNVECVPSQINQVVMNLLVNAAQALEQNGNIYIRTSTRDHEVIIEIKDDGCGIPADIIGKIFDPFFTTKEVGKGTGLGLSLSYGIIKKHLGELTVSSVPGVGTIFSITLPISHNIINDQAT